MDTWWSQRIGKALGPKHFMWVGVGDHLTDMTTGDLGWKIMNLKKMYMNEQFRRSNTNT